MSPNGNKEFIKTLRRFINEFETENERAYYFIAKIGLVVWIILIGVFGKGYAGAAPLVIFPALMYVLLQALFFLKDGLFFRKKYSRILDYLLALYAVFWAKNFCGICPAILPIILYSPLYNEEVFLYVLSLEILLILKATLFNQINPEVASIALVALAFIYLTSWKVNLIRIFKTEEKTLTNCRRRLATYRASASNYSKQLKVYWEVETIVNKLANRKDWKENLDKILANLLEAQKVEIIPLNPKRKDVNFEPDKDKKPTTQPIEVEEESFLFRVYPKLSLFAGDFFYREKVKKLVRVIKPYIEIFLANRR